MMNNKLFSNPWILVGIGGFLGAIFRYEIGGMIQKSVTEFDFFPKGTLFVNILGSFILGIVFTLYQFKEIGQSELLLFGTGFCGAFTTFSTFALESVQLNETQGTGWLIANISANLIFTLIGVILGIIIGNLIAKSVVTH